MNFIIYAMMIAFGYEVFESGDHILGIILAVAFIQGIIGRLRRVIKKDPTCKWWALEI